MLTEYHIDIPVYMQVSVIGLIGHATASIHVSFNIWESRTSSCFPESSRSFQLVQTSFHVSIDLNEKVSKQLKVAASFIKSKHVHPSEIQLTSFTLVSEVPAPQTQALLTHVYII